MSSNEKMTVARDVLREQRLKKTAVCFGKRASRTLRLRVVLFDEDGRKKKKLVKQLKLMNKDVTEADSDDENPEDMLEDRNEYMVAADDWICEKPNGDAYVVVPPVFVEVMMLLYFFQSY